MGLTQMERVHKIDQLLSEGRIMSREAILLEIGVSLSTFKRDLDFMKDRLNAPLIWDRTAGGYRFGGALGVGPRYALPGLWFNESELHALLTMQQLLHNVEPGLLARHLQPLQSKLQALLCTGNTAPEEIVKRVRIFSHGRRQMELKHFEVIATATVRRKRLCIEHFNRGADTRSERIISPQQLIYYRDNWYVDSWCHLRNAVRRFSIDSIEAVTLLPENTKEIPLKNLRLGFAKGYGIFSGDHVQWANLRINPRRARWAARVTWHPDQRVRFDSKGYFLLDLPYTDDRELLNDIMGLLPDVEILAPIQLQRRLSEILEEALKGLPPTSLPV